jgi:AcrR family transcriptional regulator
MSRAHHRKKAPEQIRRALLDHAAEMAAARGLGNISLAAVARAAGVTKGGLFHHFPTRKNLVEAVCADLVAAMDALIDGHMAAGPRVYGAFTRAYVLATLERPPRGNPWAALSMAALTDPDLRALWARWLEARLARHADTDADPDLEVVRHAADGVWLADLLGTEPKTAARTAALRERLLAPIERKMP